MAEVLQKAGYATGIFGKWGLADPGTEGTPTRKGFDEWFGFLDQVDAHNYYPPFLHRNKKRVCEGNADGRKTEYAPTCSRAKRSLSSNATGTGRFSCTWPPPFPTRTTNWEKRPAMGWKCPLTSRIPVETGRSRKRASRP